MPGALPALEGAGKDAVVPPVWGAGDACILPSFFQSPSFLLPALPSQRGAGVTLGLAITSHVPASRREEEAGTELGGTL